jgi:hypothetical protein
MSVVAGSRIFCIPALRSSTLAVIARGPSAWCHLGRWDPSAPAYEPGSWLRATIYPQRCDLSPDGRWLAYFALKGTATWPPGPTYVAVSRLPWLTALVGWGTGGTWTRGVQFEEDRDVWEVPDPDVGDPAPLRERFGLAVARAHSFAVERRRGWAESPGTPARDPRDLWDEWRGHRIVMEKARPGSGGSTLLAVSGTYAAFREAHGFPDREELRYVIVDGGGRRELDDVQWADWDSQGRLLVATAEGRLQILGDARRPDWEVDLSGRVPEPVPPPPEASEW